MPHYSKSLRAIGQSLETFGVEAFVIKKEGSNYLARSRSISPLSELTVRKDLVEKVWESPDHDQKGTRLARVDGWLRYSPSYISWLDAQGRKKRRRRFSSQTMGSKRIPQLLRTLGKHLDRLDTNAFKISWARNSVSVDYQVTGDRPVREILSVEKLRELGLRMRFRRATRR